MTGRGRSGRNRNHGLPLQLSYRFSLSRVHKDGDTALAQRLGKFGGQLVAGDNLYAFCGFLQETLRHPPPETVILPKGITVADNQHGIRHGKALSFFYVKGHASS